MNERPCEPTPCSGHSCVFSFRHFGPVRLGPKLCKKNFFGRQAEGSKSGSSRRTTPFGTSIQEDHLRPGPIRGHPAEPILCFRCSCLFSFFVILGPLNGPKLFRNNFCRPPGRGRG